MKNTKRGGSSLEMNQKKVLSPEELSNMSESGRLDIMLRSRLYSQSKSSGNNKLQMALPSNNMVTRHDNNKRRMSSSNPTTTAGTAQSNGSINNHNNSTKTNKDSKLSNGDNNGELKVPAPPAKKARPNDPELNAILSRTSLLTKEELDNMPSSSTLGGSSNSRGGQQLPKLKAAVTTGSNTQQQQQPTSAPPPVTPASTILGNGWSRKNPPSNNNKHMEDDDDDDDDDEMNMDDEYKRSPFYFLDRVKRGKKEDGFIYLRRLADQEVSPYNPYRLERVPHSMIDKNDYYTMSATGVTHFRDGEAGMYIHTVRAHTTSKHTEVEAPPLHSTELHFAKFTIHPVND